MPTSNEAYLYPETTQQEDEMKMRSPLPTDPSRTESMKDLAETTVEQNGLREFLSTESIQCVNNTGNSKLTNMTNMNTSMNSINDVTMKSEQSNNLTNSSSGGGGAGNTGGGSSKSQKMSHPAHNHHHHHHNHNHSHSSHQHHNSNGGVVEKMSRTNLYIKGLPENFDDDQLWQLPPDQTKIKSVKAATDEDTKCRGKECITILLQLNYAYFSTVKFGY
ncbi:unnamed protein product [Trichobilharzia regenti]|nr:unnamed protein product [Trichobilharzia regenti]